GHRHLREPDRDTREAAPPAHARELAAATTPGRDDERATDDADPVFAAVTGERGDRGGQSACACAALTPRIETVFEACEPQHLCPLGRGLGRLGHPLSLSRPLPCRWRGAVPRSARAVSSPPTRAGGRR